MTFFKNISLLAVVFLSLASCVNEIETAVVPSEVCEVGFSLPVDAAMGLSTAKPVPVEESKEAE